MSAAKFDASLPMRWPKDCAGATYFVIERERHRAEKI